MERKKAKEIKKIKLRTLKMIGFGGKWLWAITDKSYKHLQFITNRINARQSKVHFGDRFIILEKKSVIAVAYKLLLIFTINTVQSSKQPNARLSSC